MYPSRIICLTEETTETLYLLGEGDRVVGVSGYTVRPPEARKKPRVSAFINATSTRSRRSRPDLIFAFSDLQADIAAELVRRGYPVVHVQPAIGRRDPADDADGRRPRRQSASRRRRWWPSSARARRDSARGVASWPRRPRVYFEEWDDPLISGIQWVEELVEIAGGEPIFPELRRTKLAKDRIVDSAEVVRRDPEIIVASWCGKPVSRERIAAARVGRR